MTVAVEAAKNVLIAAERGEESLKKVGASHCAVPVASTGCVKKEEVLRQGVAFVPVPGLVAVLAPGGHGVAVHGGAGQAGERALADLVGDGQGFGAVEENVGVEEADVEFVEGVSGEAGQVEKVGGDGFRDEMVQTEDAVAAGSIPARGGKAGHGGGPLAEAMAGREACVASMRIVVGQILVPAAKVAARGVHASHGAERLEESVVVKGVENGLGVLLLRERDAGVEGNLVVAGNAEWGWPCGLGGETRRDCGRYSELDEVAAAEWHEGSL